MEIKCIVCDSRDNEIIFKNYQGYVEGSFFDIHQCHLCNSHFIIPKDDIKEIYNVIYSHTDTAGYDRYYRYAITVKNMKDPLKFLAYTESTYYPIYNFVKNKSNLKILEIGCGYGYLSYSLNQKGFDVKALDIAKAAILFAKENFGAFYYNMTIKEFWEKTNEKFDLIISTEVIEHLENPNDFLRLCVNLLKDEGQIILTTPDKDYSNKDTVWQTDRPPVHIFWIGRNGMKLLAKKNNLAVTFQDYSKYYSKYENRLVKFIVSRKERFESPFLNKEGFPIVNVPPSIYHSTVSFLVHKISPIRFLSNLIFNLFNGKEITLGVFLKKISKENSVK
jgi:2-polyprenyl-3-methyl-5-hydroxy-6-metoxy-1,4-benzoquinol methylase